MSGLEVLGTGVVAGLACSGKVSVVHKLTFLLSFEEGEGAWREPSCKGSPQHGSPEKGPPVLSEWRENVVGEEVGRRQWVCGTGFGFLRETWNHLKVLGKRMK